MNFGEAHKKRYGECSKETAFEILDFLYGQGGNFIDTADAYQAGESEIWLGEWINSESNRDQIVLTTKYSTAHRTHEIGKIQFNYGGNGLKFMRLSLDASFHESQTDYIDLFYLHWWYCLVSKPELMHGFREREQHNPGRKAVPFPERNRKVSAVLEKISKAKGVKPLDIALAYVL